MELPTYTSAFTLERRLYALYDLELPAPVSLTQAATFGAVVALVVVVARAAGLGLSARTAWLFVVPPWGAAWAASRPLIEARRPHRWLLSQLRWLAQPRVLHRLEPERQPELVAVSLRVTRASAARLGRRSPDAVPWGRR